MNLLGVQMRGNVVLDKRTFGLRISVIPSKHRLSTGELKQLISLGALKPWGFCAFRSKKLLSERSDYACQDGSIVVFREWVMLDQSPLTKALLSYRFGGLVGAYIG